MHQVSLFHFALNARFDWCRRYWRMTVSKCRGFFFSPLSKILKQQCQGSGCSSVGRAVASDIRGPRFESSHRQKFIYIEHLFIVYCQLCIEKTKIKKKEAVDGPFL